MKYDLKQIMKRAWVIKRKNKKNLFGLCLRMSWMEFKKSLNDRLLNDILNEFCSFKRPKYYRKNMSNLSMIKLLNKNNIPYPEESKGLIEFLYPCMIE